MRIRTPLRRVVACVLSVLILPWQQPLLALAEPNQPVVTIDLKSPRDPLTLLDARVAPLLERIKSDEPAGAVKPAELPAKLAELKAAYKSAQDSYAEAEKQAKPESKPVLKALAAPSTGQLVVDAVVEADLGGIRKDLSALLALQASLSRPASAIKPEEWADVEKAVPDLRAGLGPLSSRVEKARNVPGFAVKDVEDAYRPLVAALDKSFQNLRAGASRLDLAGLLAARPATASGDAAGILTAELQAALGNKVDAGKYASVNAKLAGYLRSGKPEDLNKAIAEMDLLFDAAGVKDKDLRAGFFERVGQVAQRHAGAAEAAAANPPPSASVINSNGIKKETDLQSMRRLDAVRLDLEDPSANRSAGLAAALSAWWTKGREASGPAWEAVRRLLPEAGGAGDPLAFAGEFARNAFAASTFGDADPAGLAARLGSASGAAKERATTLRESSRADAAATAASEASAKSRDEAIAVARRLAARARAQTFAPPADPDKPWRELDPKALADAVVDFGTRDAFLNSPALVAADKAAATAAWDEARAAWSSGIAAMYGAVTTEVVAAIRRTKEAEGAAAPEAAKVWLRAVESLFGQGPGQGAWPRLEEFWAKNGAAAGPEAKAARDKAVEAVALVRALIAAQTPPTSLAQNFRDRMIDADGKILPFGQAIVASNAAKLDRNRKMGAFLETLSQTLGSGKSDAETAAALKAAFDGNRDLLSPADDLTVLASGLLAPPPAGDAKALESFTARRKALTAAVDVLRSADPERNGSDAALTRGFAQYNAFLYAHLVSAGPDSEDGKALAGPLAAKRDAFVAAYRDGAGGLSDEPPRLGQVALARLAREIAEQLPSLKAKRDAASAQSEFVAALDALSPERRETLVADRDKLAADAEKVGRLMARAESLRRQGERIEELRLKLATIPPQANQAELAAALAEQRRIFDGDGGAAAANELAAYRVAGMGDGDWAGVRAEIARRLEAKNGELATFDKARAHVEAALAGTESEAGDGRTLALDEVRRRAKRQSEWALVRDARAMMGSLAYYQDPARKDELTRESAALRDETLRRLYYSDYQPAASARLRGLADTGTLDAAQVTAAVSGIVDPRLVNLAFLERAKILQAKSRAQRAGLTSFDQEVLAAWESYKKLLTELAGGDARNLAKTAMYADQMADRDPSHWTDAALTPQRREFLEYLGVNAEIWRANVECMAGGGCAEKARKFDEQVRQWRSQTASSDASLYARGAELSDPALTLRALSAAVAEYKSRDASWNPPFTVLDEAWARGLLSQADPRAALRGWADGLVDTQRERLFDSTFRQDQDYLDKTVGERLTAYAAEKGLASLDAGSAKQIAALARLYQTKKEKEEAFAALDDGTQEAGRLLFGARAQLASELLRAWETKRLPEVVLAGGARDPDFAVFLNDDRIKSLRRVETPMSGGAVFDAVSGKSVPGGGAVVGVAMTRVDGGVRTLTVHASNGGATLVHTEAIEGGWKTVMSGDRTLYRSADGTVYERGADGLKAVAAPDDLQTVYRTALYRGVDDAGRPKLVQSSSYAVAGGPRLSGGRELNRTVFGADGTTTSYDFVAHSQFVAKKDGTAFSYTLSNDNRARAANLAVTELRRDPNGGEYVVEGRRYLREAVGEDGKKIPGRMQATYERNEGSGLWSVHDLGDISAAAPKNGRPESMYLVAPDKPLGADRARLLAAATAAKVERQLPMGENNRAIGGLTTAFLSDQLLAHDAKLGRGQRSDLSLSFDGATRDGQARTMQASITDYFKDAAGKMQSRTRSVLAQYQSLETEDKQNRGGLVIFDGGKMSGIYVADGAAGAKFLRASVETRSRSDTWYGFVGAVVAGEKNYEQTVFGDGKGPGFKLKEVDVTRPPREVGLAGYGILGVLTGAPIADAVSIAAEEIALYCGASARTAKIIGAVAGAGADIALGIITMGPAVVKLIEVAGKYGKMLKIGLDVYFAYEGVKGGVEGYHALKNARNDQEFADALRGFIGSAVNVGMIAYMHMKTRPNGRAAEGGREIETPKGPEAPQADPSLKKLAAEKPVAEKPATEKPAVEKPVTEQPAPERPAPKPEPRPNDPPPPPAPEGRPVDVPRGPVEAPGRPPMRVEAPKVDAGRSTAEALTQGTRGGTGGDIAAGGTKASANAGGGAGETAAARAASPEGKAAAPGPVEAGKGGGAPVAEAAPGPKGEAAKSLPVAEARPVSEVRSAQAKGGAEKNGARAVEAEAAQRVAPAPAEAGARAARPEAFARAAAESLPVAEARPLAEASRPKPSAERSAGREAKAAEGELFTESAEPSARPERAAGTRGEASYAEASRPVERVGSAAEPAAAETVPARETARSVEPAPTERSVAEPGRVAEARPASEAPRVVEPAKGDAELLHADAEPLARPAPAKAAPAEAGGSRLARAEASMFNGVDAVGRGLESLAGKLHASNRAGPRVAAGEPSLAARVAAKITDLPRKFVSNVMAEVGEHLRKPVNTAADAGEASFRNFGERPEFARLVESRAGGRPEPGAEVRVKVGVDPETGALRFGGETGPVVEVRARARADGKFELLDVGAPEGALSARASQHLDWVADRALGVDGPPKGVVRAALDRMGFEAPSLVKDAGFREAASRLENGRGLLEGSFDPRTGELRFGPAPEGAVKLSLEVRMGEGGAPEIAGFRAEGSGARVEAAAAREIARRLEPSFRVEKIQRSLDKLVDSRSGRLALEAGYDAATGAAKLEASWNPKSGKLSVGKGAGVDLLLRFGRDETGALRLEGVDSPGRAQALPAALEHNLRLFAGRRAVEPASSIFRRGETAESLDATLKRSLEVADTRVRAEELVRRRELFAELREAGVEARAARRAEPSAALHAELVHAASRAVEAGRAAEFARADAAAAEAEIAGLSRSGRRAIPELESAYREFSRTTEARKAARAAAEGGEPAAVEAYAKSLEAERRAGEDFAAARRGVKDSAIDALVRRENANARRKAASAEEAAALRNLDATLASARVSAPAGDVRLSLAEGRLAGAREAFRKQNAQLEYRRDGIARALGGDGFGLERTRMLLETGEAAAPGRLSVGQEAGRQHCALATAADMYAAKTGTPVSEAMSFAERAVIEKFQAEARAERTGSGEPRADWEAAGKAKADAFLEDTGLHGMNRAQIDWVMHAVAEKAGLRAVELGAADSPFSRLAAGEQLGVVLADASAGGHMVNLSNWRMAKNPVTGRAEAWIDVADPNTRALSGFGPGGAPVYEARVYSMRASDVVTRIRSRFGDGELSAAAYLFEGGGAGPRSPPMSEAAVARRMGAAERVGAGEAVAGVAKPARVEAPGKVFDPAILPEDVCTPEIMAVAREYGLVYELGPATLPRMKPGVEHNFVIVENPNGTIEMTVGRLAPGNAKEMGVKHVALGDGRSVPFAGGIRIDPVSGRPRLDFNSGTYSRFGLDPRWAPNPENARALASYAEAILKTPVEIVDHFDGRLIDLRAARPVDMAANRALLERTVHGGGTRVDQPPLAWTEGSAGRPKVELDRVLSGEGSSAIVFEGRLDGRVVAVKTHTTPLAGPQDWPSALEYFRNEVANYRILEDALPKGQVAKLHGEVEVGGNPSFATELIRGKETIDLTAAEARRIPPEAIEQAADAVTRLERRGVGGGDSPQPMILTADQTINGVPRRAGDVVFMDAGALTTNRSRWQKPATLAQDLAMARELAARAPAGMENMTVAKLYKALPPEVVAQARAAARARGELAEAGSASRLASEGVGAAPEAPRLIARAAGSRDAGWTVDGRPAKRLSGGAFKEVLIHPSNENLVLKLFSEAGVKDGITSLSEKRREMRNLSPLLEIGRAPKVVDEGATIFDVPGRGKKTTGYVVQERVAGRELGDMLRDPDPAVRAKAMSEARALFDDLVAARVKLEDRIKMHENISVGRAGGEGPVKAWVLDAGEASRAAKPGLLDSLRGRPDPLRAYYDSVLSDLARISRRAEPAAARGRSEGVGAGFFDSLLGGGKKAAPSVPERILWPVEAGGPEPARLNFAGLKLDGRLANLEGAHTNVLAVELDGRKAILKVDAKPNEARVLAAMGQVELPANVRIPKLLGDAPADVMALHRLAGDAPGAIDYGAVKRSAAEGRHMIAVERLPDDFVSMHNVEGGSAKLKAPISAADWQGLLDAVKILGRKGLAFGDLQNTTNIRLRQIPDGNGGFRTEFALIDAGQGTLKGNMDALGSDFVQLKGERALETRLLESGKLAARGRLADPRAAAMARSQVPMAQKLAEQLNTAMATGEGRTPVADRVRSRRFTDLGEAAAYLRAPDGIHLLQKTSEGLAGDAVRVEVGGQDWYLKRVSKKLGDAIDDGLRGLSGAQRAGNELALREVVRRWFGESFRVSPEALTIEHGGEIWVMTKGAPAAPDVARIKTMTAEQRADYALLRLVFRAEDLNRGNVLFGKDAKPTLIDFEKVIAEPLDPVKVAREADNEIFVKGFPIVGLEGNNPAVYRARADALRARFADPAFKAELNGILESAGWAPERRAAYLSAVETNLKNFEVNIKPYLDAANKVAAQRRGREGVGAGRDDRLPDFLAGEKAPDALREFARKAAAHQRDAWSLKDPDVRRSDGIKGAHEWTLFRAALAEAHGSITFQKDVPGFPGMTYVQYRLYQGDGKGGFKTDFKSEIYEKTVFDGAIWSESHLAELGGAIFGKVGRDGQFKIPFRGVTWIGWIRGGELTSWGADHWPGQPPLYPDVPAARTPVPKKNP